MPVGPEEKRRDKRLQLNLPVKFSTGADPGLTVRTGVTHNVSSGGVYFEAPAAQIAMSDSLWLRIGVPARPHEEKANLTLVGTGSVCRVDRLSPELVLGSWPDPQLMQGICGVALQFEQRPTIELRSIEELLWDERR